MALLLVGKSVCQICGQLIKASDEVRMFPAFLKSSHRMYRYSDAPFHKQCFEASPDRDEVERLFAKFRDIWDHRPSNLTMEEAEAWGRSAFAEFE